MKTNKLRARVTLHHAITRFLEFGITRIVFAMKGPIRMRAELFIAFVEAIGGQEKRLRIRDVNGHRHVESSGRFPHLIEQRANFGR
jgi:hypothetical protein